MERHFTATAYLLHEGRVLLHYHKKLSAWLPPGGHIEPNEMPHEAAIREVKEETGLDIEILEQENIKIDCATSKSFPRPYLCLLEKIPASVYAPEHEHMDLIYLARPKGLLGLKEGFQWFSYEELPNNLLVDVRQTLELLLKDYQRRC